MKKLTVCLMIALSSGSLCSAVDRKVTRVIPWGVECNPFMSDVGARMVCFGYEPLPRAIFHDPLAEAVEVEPLPAADSRAQPGASGDSNGSPSAGGDGGSERHSPVAELDEIRARRAETIDDHLDGSDVKDRIAKERRIYQPYANEIVLQAGVAMFDQGLDPIPIVTCKAADGECESESSEEGNPRELDVRRLLLQYPRIPPLADIADRTALAGLWPKDSLEFWRYTHASISKVDAFEAKRVTTLLDASTKLNNTMSAIRDGGITQAIPNIRAQLESAERVVVAGIFAPLSEASLKDAMRDATFLLDPSLSLRLQERRILEPANDLAAEDDDRWARIHARVQQSQSVSPQSRRARGLIQLLAQESRAARVAGRTAQAEADAKIAESLLDIALGAVPVVGIGKDVYEAVLGISIVDGSALCFAERGFAVFGVLTGGFGDDIAKALFRLISRAHGMPIARRIFGHTVSISRIVEHKTTAERITGVVGGGNLNSKRNLLDSLRLQEYLSIYDDLGRLRPDVIARSKDFGAVTSPRWREILIRDGSSIDDWRYMSYIVRDEFGAYELRYYRNRVTGAVEIVKSHVDRGM